MINALVLMQQCDNDELYDRSMEMKDLLESLEAEPYFTVEKYDRIKPSTYLTEGKILRLQEIIKSNPEIEFKWIVCDFNLTGNQQANLEDIFGLKVIDKTLLILMIFESRAKSKESKLQVEIAKLQYMSSHLVHEDANYSQVTSGSGHNKGSGEKEKELEKRRIHHAIYRKTIELDNIKKARKTSRNLRNSNGIPLISVCGYTNAGKSSFINYLVKNSKQSNQKMLFEKNLAFATLETSTRLVDYYSYPSFLLTDTVGFMRDLPHFLISAFRSTLEEITESDLIVEMVDVSSPFYKENMDVTDSTLEALNANEIPKVYIFNKIDRLPEGELPFIPKRNELFISLKDDEQNADEIIKFLMMHITSNWKKYNMFIPYDINLAMVLKENYVIKKEEKENGYFLTAYISPKFINKYLKYVIL